MYKLPTASNPPRLNERGVIHLFFLVSALILIAFLGAAYFSPLKEQLFSVLKRNSNSFASSSTDTSYNLGVLVIKYFPLTADGQNIDINVTGDVGDPYPTIRQKTVDLTNNLLTFMPKSTKYLGYKDANSQPSINLSLVDTKEYTQAVPMLTDGTRRPEYNKLLTDNNICSYVDTQNVREVFLWAYQGPTYPGGSGAPYLSISESKMSGPYGDISNSPRYDDMPKCAHTYRVYTFNYQRGTSEAMESWGHQIEAELSAVDNTLFRNLWQGPNYPQTLGVNGRCGSVHNPPNARSEYDRSNPSPQKSDCLEWNPDGLGALSDISCTNWGCQDVNDSNNGSLNYMVWNWQNLPGRNNTKTYLGKQLRNWWDIHGDFDGVMSSDRTLALPEVLPATVVYAKDGFNRGDDSQLGSTETGQSWEVLKGSFGIQNNTAYSTAGCPAPGYAVVNTGTSDGVYEIKLAVNAQDLRIPFRVADLNNMYWVETKGGNTYEVDKMVNGVQGVLGSLSGVTAQNGDILKIVVKGDKINIYVNNLLKGQFADSSVAGTKYGVGLWCNGAVRFDDFVFSKFETASPSPSASLPPSPTPTPTSTPQTGPLTVTFDDLSNTNSALTGQYPAGVIDWGSSRWLLSAPRSLFTTNSIMFSDSSISSASFTFLSPKKLVSLRAYNRGTSSATITLSCSGNPKTKTTIAKGKLATITTKWVNTCGSVTVTTNNNQNTNFDDLVIQ